MCGKGVNYASTVITEHVDAPNVAPTVTGNQLEKSVTVGHLSQDNKNAQCAS